MENKSFIRKQMRAKNYDYTLPGMYFITICINEKLKLLGEIKNGELISFKNEPDKLIIRGLFELENQYPNLFIDEFVVMPNHLHFIINLTKKSEKSIAEIVKSYKIWTTKRYIDGVKAGKYLRFNNKLWQKDFYDHIVRNDEDLYNIRKYIIENPIKWELDEMYW